MPVFPNRGSLFRGLHGKDSSASADEMPMHLDKGHDCLKILVTGELSLPRPPV